MLVSCTGCGSAGSPQVPSSGKPMKGLKKIEVHCPFTFSLVVNCVFVVSSAAATAEKVLILRTIKHKSLGIPGLRAPGLPETWRWG